MAPEDVPVGPESREDGDVVDFESWGPPAVVLRGAAAAARGRALLEAAGVDVKELERRVVQPSSAI